MLDKKIIMINALIYIFLVLIAWYHIIGTGIVFGLHLSQYNTSITFIRDILRLLIVIFASIKHRTKIIPWLQKNKHIIRTLIATITLSIIISIYVHKSIFSMFVWLKYDFMFTLILLSASLLGFMSQKIEIDKYIKLYISIILIGYMRQAARLRAPDFMHRLWYGPVGDYVFGQNPPIYYRTWPWWDPRLQGIFAWPNNYGYFLIAIAPVLYTRFKNKTKTIKTSIWSILRVGVLLTLSRWALIGWIVWLISTYRNKIKQYKKIMRGVIGLIIIGLLGLSIVKRWSTVQHIQNKIDGVQAVIQQPLGYGLWSAGPAIHHQGQRLPENFYLQIMIDIGSIGFILWAIYSYLLMKQTKDQQDMYLTSFLIGRYALMIVWLFLHVFEDSMVNYLFFVPYGLLLWYNLQKS